MPVPKKSKSKSKGKTKGKGGFTVTPKTWNTWDAKASTSMMISAGITNALRKSNKRKGGKKGTHHVSLTMFDLYVADVLKWRQTPGFLFGMIHSSLSMKKAADRVAQYCQLNHRRDNILMSSSSGAARQAVEGLQRCYRKLQELHTTLEAIKPRNVGYLGKKRRKLFKKKRKPVLGLIEDAYREFETLKAHVYGFKINAKSTDDALRDPCSVKLGAVGEKTIRRFGPHKHPHFNSGMCVVNGKGVLDLSKGHLYCAAAEVKPEIPIRACTTKDKGIIVVKHLRKSEVIYVTPDGTTRQVKASFIKISVCGKRKKVSKREWRRSCVVRKLLYRCEEGGGRCKGDAAASATMSV
jgi:hypothetical protein